MSPKASDVDLNPPAPEQQELPDAEVVDGEPAPELHEAIADATAIEAYNPPAGDQHAGMVAMDAHDSAALVDRIVRQAQERNLGKRWVYELKGAGRRIERGLTVDAVEDITQQMNWTGKCRIRVLPETLDVKREDHDEGDGPEPWWVATVAAEDELSGAIHIGTSSEPQRMKLKASTVQAKRSEGKKVPEDNRVFDRFSRAKAVNKAQRNALEAHIPEAVKVTLIAMAAKDPAIVERIQSDAEAKVSELPAPLDTPEARELIAELGRMYDEIREFGGGRGRILLPPGQYNAYLVQAQHSMELLGRMKAWLEQRRTEIRTEVGG